MDYADARRERRELKQRLFYIRRFMSGENLELDVEHKRLKKLYESMSEFTSWEDFPESWDVGDPNRVKASAHLFNHTDKENTSRIAGKSYNTIVKLEQKPLSRQEVEALAQLQDK